MKNFLLVILLVCFSVITCWSQCAPIPFNIQVNGNGIIEATANTSASTSYWHIFDSNGLNYSNCVNMDSNTSFISMPLPNGTYTIYFSHYCNGNYYSSSNVVTLTNGINLSANFTFGAITSNANGATVLLNPICNANDEWYVSDIWGGSISYPTGTTSINLPSGNYNVVHNTYKCDGEIYETYTNSIEIPCPPMSAEIEFIGHEDLCGPDMVFLQVNVTGAAGNIVSSEWVYPSGYISGYNSVVYGNNYTTAQGDCLYCIVTDEYGCTATAPTFCTYYEDYCQYANASFDITVLPNNMVGVTLNGSSNWGYFTVNNFWSDYGNNLGWGGVNYDTLYFSMPSSGTYTIYNTIYGEGGAGNCICTEFSQQVYLCDSIHIDITPEIDYQNPGTPPCNPNYILNSVITNNNPSNSYTYDWSVQNLGQGDYGFHPTIANALLVNDVSFVANLTITDELGCVGSATMTGSGYCFGNADFSYSLYAGVVTLNAITPYQDEWQITSANFNQNYPASTFSVALNPDTYMVKHFVYDCDGNICQRDSQIIIVPSCPNINANIIGNTPICSGETAALTANANLNNNYSYIWSNGDTSKTITVSPAITTSYSVIITDSIGCASSANISVVVNEKPIVSPIGNTTICAGQNVNLVANVSGGNTPYIYSWNGTILGNNISITPNNTTSYTVLLTDANNCTATASTTINVKPSPILSIAGNTSICLGESTVLTANIIGGQNPYTYTWTTGSQSPSINIAPVNISSYSVIVNSINGCSASANTTINVNSNPIATISGSTMVCSGQNTSLNVNTQGGVSPYSYSWSNGQMGNSITINPTTLTNYMVIVKDANNCTTNTSLIVNTNNLSVNGINSVANSTTNCGSLTFSANISNGNPPYTYSWQFMNNSNGAVLTSNLVSPSQVFANPTNGNYNACVWVTDNTGCQVSKCSPIFFNCINSCQVSSDFCYEVQALTSSTATVIPVKFTANAYSTTNTTYSWTIKNASQTFTNSTNSNTFTPSLTAGNYTVTLNIQRNLNGVQCCQKCERQIEITLPCSIPTGIYTYYSSNSANGGNITLSSAGTATATASNPYTYSWLVNGVFLASGTSSVMSNTNFSSGLYDVCLKVENRGCRKDFCRKVYMPEPTCNINGNFRAKSCNITPLFVNYIPYNIANVQNYSWDFGDGTSAIGLGTPTLITHLYNSPGLYQVCLQLTKYTGCSIRICYTIAVNLPNCSLNCSNGAFKMNLNGNIGEIDNDSLVSQTQIENIIIPEADDYEVITNNENLNFLLSPNPTQDISKLSFQISRDIFATILLYSIEGKLVWEKETYFEKGNQVLEIPTKNLTAGVYLLHFISELGEYQTKLVVEKY